jgi:hypothetical protein
MFHQTRPDTICSDTGFSVIYTGRFTLDYIEGEKKTLVFIEPLPGGQSRIVSPEKIIKWTNINGDAAGFISDQKRLEIIANINQVFQYEHPGDVIDISCS